MFEGDLTNAQGPAAEGPSGVDMVGPEYTPHFPFTKSSSQKRSSGLKVADVADIPGLRVRPLFCLFCSVIH
jgi:hypothetical protein